MTFYAESIQIPSVGIIVFIFLSLIFALIFHSPSLSLLLGYLNMCFIFNRWIDDMKNRIRYNFICTHSFFYQKSLQYLISLWLSFVPEYLYMNIFVNRFHHHYFRNNYTRVVFSIKISIICFPQNQNPH